MKIREKMNIFYSSALEAANRQSNEEMRKFSVSMEMLLEEFRKNKKEEMDLRYGVEAGKLRRDGNRKVSEALTEQKRKLNQHQTEKKEALFAVVSSMLENYRKTEEYQAYLIAKIRMAKEFAGSEEAVIYIDPLDQEKKGYLEEQCGCGLTVSEWEFGGGIRAVIRSKNILIDESFQTKLNQEQESYTF